MVGGEVPIDDTQDQKIADFLKSKGVRFECPACGSREANTDEATGLEPMFPFYQKEHGSAVPRAVLPIYVLTCRNCGFIRVFDRKIVGGAA